MQPFCPNWRFERYEDFDVFYFYNPFGRGIFEPVLEKLKESRTRDTAVRVYLYPKEEK